MSLSDLISKSFALVFSKLKSSPKKVFFFTSIDYLTLFPWDLGRAVFGLTFGFVQVFLGFAAGGSRFLAYFRGLNPRSTSVTVGGFCIIKLLDTESFIEPWSCFLESLFMAAAWEWSPPPLKDWTGDLLLSVNRDWLATEVAAPPEFFRGITPFLDFTCWLVVVVAFLTGDEALSSVYFKLGLWPSSGL